MVWRAHERLPEMEKARIWHIHAHGRPRGYVASFLFILRHARAPRCAARSAPKKAPAARRVRRQPPDALLPAALHAACHMRRDVAAEVALQRREKHMRGRRRLEMARPELAAWRHGALAGRRLSYREASSEPEVYNVFFVRQYAASARFS